VRGAWKNGPSAPSLDGVFEGLLAPWHLVIIAFVLFMVVGPQKLAARWQGTTETISRWADGEDAAPAPEAPAEPTKPKKPSLAMRLGRRFRRLRRRRG
jgi:hypothetical protein